MLTLLAKALFRVFALILLVSAVVSAQARGIVAGHEPSTGPNPPASGAKSPSRAGPAR